MNLSDQIKPITYLKNNTAKVVREASENGNTLYITQNGEAKAVVLGARQYDRMREAMAMLKILAMSEASESVPHKQAMAEVEAALQSASRRG